MKISGKKMKIAREKKGMSRAELSRVSGVKIRTLEDWESGKRNPRNFDLIDQIVRALECDISDLYDDSYLSSLNQQALANTMRYEDEELEEAELVEKIEAIYQFQDVQGILKLMDRFIYHLGVNKALQITKEFEDESNESSTI